MQNTTPIKKKTKGCTIVIPSFARTNFLSIQTQIALQARSRRNDKSHTRNKGKAWRKEHGV
jgi:hypothetical protein